LRSHDSGYETNNLYDSQEHSLEVESDSRPLKAENLARAIEEYANSRPLKFQFKKFSEGVYI